MSGRAERLPALIALAAAAMAGVVVATGADESVRAPVVVAFLLVCPGLALAAAAGVRGVWETLGAAVTLSISADLLVALVAMNAGAWSPDGIFAAIAGMTAAAALVALGRKAAG